MTGDETTRPSDSPLHTIKKVTIVRDKRTGIPPSPDQAVNELLAKGWVLLGVSTAQGLVYTLGDADACADDTVEAIYTRPEDL